MHALAIFTGPTEWIIIGLIVVVLFGAKRLPELARAMGSSLTQFKKGMRDPDELPEGGSGDAAADAESKEST